MFFCVGVGRMSAGRRVIVNTALLYARMAITISLSLYTTRITLDALDIHDFGVYALASGTVSSLAFINSGLTSASQRFMNFWQGAERLAEQREVFKSSLMLHIVAAAFVLL